MLAVEDWAEIRRLQFGEKLSVIRSMSVGDGWTGVTWCDLDHVSADAVIAAQISRFAEVSRPWEWKHYSYDQPPDLPDRLLAAGFAAQPTEALLVAEIARLTLDATPPAGVELVDVANEEDVETLVAVHDHVFGGDHSAMGKTLLTHLKRRPSTAGAVVAVAGRTPIAAGRVEFHPGTDFASLWGGGTLAAWRGRGVFRSLVARRARLASARGLRYLQVDASPDSRLNSLASRLRRACHHDPIHAPGPSPLMARSSLRR